MDHSELNGSRRITIRRTYQVAVICGKEMSLPILGDATEAVSSVPEAVVPHCAWTAQLQGAGHDREPSPESFSTVLRSMNLRVRLIDLPEQAGWECPDC